MTAGARNPGDNIIDRTTVGPFANEPAFPNNNATNPSGQGGSYVWGGPGDPSAPSDGGVEQNFDPAEQQRPNPENPEQAYAKPTDASTPAALGPGMRSRG